MSGTRSRSVGSWLAFCALALYGTLRWGTMLGSAEQGRLFGSLLLAVLAAVVVRRLPSGSGRWALVPLLIVGAIALLEIAGFPLGRHHVGRLASELSRGLSSLSGLLVPYNGGDPATAAVLVLGAGLLLFCAALAFGSVRRGPGTAHLALAALPLAGLVVVPSEIFEPRLSYFHGLLTFALVAVLVFSPRLAPDRRGSAGAVLVIAALAGAIGAGLVAGDRLWISTAGVHLVSGAGGQGSPLLAEEFNWQQTYGAKGWPYSGAEVVKVTAPRPEHWKAEDLDSFDGTGWSLGLQTNDAGLTGVSAAHLAAYSETVTVTAERIFTNQIIAAGYADRPDLGGIAPGADNGTWFSGLPVRPGEAYRVHVYVPQPPAAQLAAAGTDYPRALAAFRTLSLPTGVYAGVRALARRLAVGTDSPYAYVEAVLDYLQHGYVYTLNPPGGGSYPLVDFLLHSRRGYCQQFAGAMALLLRMNGVPARVAVGFLPGERRPGSDTYVVADRDAHAWVEVWFPSFGWVTFDPTPGRATAAGSSPSALTPISAGAPVSSRTPQVHPAPKAVSRAKSLARHLAGSHGGASVAAAPRRGASTTLVTVALALAGLLGLGLAARLAHGFWRRPSATQLTAELERAFSLCEQPLEASITLEALERLLSDSPAAAGYVSSLAAARFGPAETVSLNLQGRAALRRWLAHGGGPGGWLRALRALPPRRQSGNI